MTEKSRLQTVGNAIALGLTFPACIVAGYFLGKGADHLLGSAPYGSYVGGVAGIAAGFWNLYQIARRAESDEK